jgi:hypothetical protein
MIEDPLQGVRQQARMFSTAPFKKARLKQRGVALQSRKGRRGNVRELPPFHIVSGFCTFIGSFWSPYSDLPSFDSKFIFLTYTPWKLHAH